MRTDNIQCLGRTTGQLRADLSCKAFDGGLERVHLIVEGIRTVQRILREDNAGLLGLAGQLLQGDTAVIDDTRKAVRTFAKQGHCQRVALGLVLHFGQRGQGLVKDRRAVTQMTVAVLDLNAELIPCRNRCLAGRDHVLLHLCGRLDDIVNRHVDQVRGILPFLDVCRRKAALLCQSVKVIGGECAFERQRRQTGCHGSCTGNDCRTGFLGVVLQGCDRLIFKRHHAARSGDHAAVDCLAGLFRVLGGLDQTAGHIIPHRQDGVDNLIFSHYSVPPPVHMRGRLLPQSGLSYPRTSAPARLVAPHGLRSSSAGFAPA